LLGVLTRNHYGAIVLNTDSVFFGDIDVKAPGTFSKLLRIFGRPEKNKSYYVDKIEVFQQANPQYTIKVYETFAGLRVVILNELFKNKFDVASSIFSDLEVDTLFSRLCKAQSCYRARLTPKPWRMGMERPGSRFPRGAADQADFQKWLNGYESSHRAFSTARHLETFGGATPHTDVMSVLMTHDRYACSGQEHLA
jgi:hypothetical protein